LLARLKAAVVKPVPPELEACEVCGQLTCSESEWQSCEKRLAAAEFARTGSDAALARLEKAHRTASRTGDARTSKAD
jgi:hypothetical protein